jgi:hypothetical protein
MPLDAKVGKAFAIREGGQVGLRSQRRSVAMTRELLGWAWCGPTRKIVAAHLDNRACDEIVDHDPTAARQI